MIGKTIMGLVILVVVFTIARANGVSTSDMMGWMETFLTAGADVVMELWAWISDIVTSSQADTNTA